jgi:hypothetical protein
MWRTTSKIECAGKENHRAGVYHKEIFCFEFQALTSADLVSSQAQRLKCFYRRYFSTLTLTRERNLPEW